MLHKIIRNPLDPNDILIEGTNFHAGNEPDEDSFTFTINIAPLEIDSVEVTENAVNNEIEEGLDKEIEYLSKIREIIQDFRSRGTIKLERDFYWNEQDLLLNITVPKTHPAVQLNPVAITKGLKLQYKGFGSNVGEIYEVVASNERVTRLKGKVFGRLTDFEISTKDLLETINITKDYIVVPDEPK